MSPVYVFSQIAGHTGVNSVRSQHRIPCDYLESPPNPETADYKSDITGDAQNSQFWIDKLP